MLVSSIARFNAINTMNNAAFASMQASNAIVNLAAHPFGGEPDLSMLNQMDKKLSMELATNSLLYKLAYFQEKMAAQQQKNDIKSFSVMA